MLSQRSELEEISGEECKPALRQKLSSVSTEVASSVHKDSASPGKVFIFRNSGDQHGVWLLEVYAVIVGLLRLDLLPWRHCPGVY